MFYEELIRRAAYCLVLWGLWVAITKSFAGSPSYVVFAEMSDEVVLGVSVACVAGIAINVHSWSRRWLIMAGALVFGLWTAILAGFVASAIVRIDEVGLGAFTTAVPMYGYAAYSTLVVMIRVARTKEGGAS